MNSSITIGLLVALGAGMAIGIQGTFINLLGQSMSPLRGGFAVHFSGAIVGAVMIGFVMLTNPNFKALQITPSIIFYSLIAGLFGMLIVMGVAFSFPRIGQVAGQASIIIAQLSIALIVDTFALAGGEPLPLDRQRILGLIIVAVGTYLLLPQQNQ